MRPNFLYSYLHGQPLRHFLVGIVLTLLFLPLGLRSLAELRVGPDPVSLGLALVLNLLGVASLIVAGRAVWAMYDLESNPDVPALKRYGSLEKVLAEVDHELTQGPVVSIGGQMKALHFADWHVDELQMCRVLLTPSWLVYLWGKENHRLSCLRWDDLVMISQMSATRTDVNGLERAGKAAVLIDRYDVRVEIVGTEMGITRLLTNVMARAPWAVYRLDGSVEQSWHDNREQIIAEVDRRRDSRSSPRDGTETGVHNPETT